MFVLYSGSNSSDPFVDGGVISFGVRHSSSSTTIVK